MRLKKSETLLNQKHIIKRINNLNLQLEKTIFKKQKLKKKCLYNI